MALGAASRLPAQARLRAHKATPDDARSRKQIRSDEKRSLGRRSSAAADWLPVGASGLPLSPLTWIDPAGACTGPGPDPDWVNSREKGRALLARFWECPILRQGLELQARDLMRTTVAMPNKPRSSHQRYVGVRLMRPPTLRCSVINHSGSFPLCLECRQY